MADNEADGVMNQDDINAALAASGLDAPSDQAAGDATPAGSPEGSAQDGAQPFGDVADAMVAAVRAEAASAPSAGSSSASPLPVPELETRPGRDVSPSAGIICRAVTEILTRSM